MSHRANEDSTHLFVGSGSGGSSSLRLALALLRNNNFWRGCDLCADVEDSLAGLCLCGLGQRLGEGHGGERDLVGPGGVLEVRLDELWE